MRGYFGVEIKKVFIYKINVNQSGLMESFVSIFFFDTGWSNRNSFPVLFQLVDRS